MEFLCKVVREDGGSKLDWPQPLGVDPRSWGFSTRKKPPRSGVKPVRLQSCSVEIWACRQSNGLCESGAYWFFSGQLSPLLVFSFFLGAGKVGHTVMDNRWFLGSSVEGEWLKGKVKKKG